MLFRSINLLWFSEGRTQKLKSFSKILRNLASKLNFFEKSFFGVTLRKQVWRPLKWAKNGPLTFFPNSHLPEENFEGSWSPLGEKMAEL